MSLIMNPAPTRRRHERVADAKLTRRRCLADTLPTYRERFADAKPTRRQCDADATRRRREPDATPMRRRRVADATPMRHRLIANALPYTPHCLTSLQHHFLISPSKQRDASRVDATPTHRLCVADAKPTPRADDATPTG